MEGNNLKYTNYDTSKIIKLKYKKAQKYERSQNYKEAISLYEDNIKIYNDSSSKIALARLYLDRKTTKIDNKRVRTLLEEAYMQNNFNGVDLLAYVWANGIGGEKHTKEACQLFFDELKNNNSDPMVYIELAKLLPNNNKNKILKKHLKYSVSKFEKINYNRKKNIDIFNNIKLGRIVNKIPNFFYIKLQNFFDKQKDEKLAYGMQEIYDKACNTYDSGNYDAARVIFTRLTNLGDDESSIKLSKMLSMGLGGEKDIETSRALYENILNKRDLKLSRIEKDILDMKKDLECTKKKSKVTLKDKKSITQIKDEIEYLKYRRDSIMRNSTYNEALLNYGLLLVDNSKSREDFETGISILKSFSDYGELIPEKNSKLNKYGKEYNRRAIIAIKKLGNLYESKKWQPENIVEARSNFLKYTTGRVSGYTSYIADKMKKSINNEENIDEIYNVPKNKSNKKCKLRYNLGTLFDVLNIKSIARKIYTSMSQSGDYRCSQLLANLEQKGKGGKKDLDSAIEHYKEYIQYTNNNIEEYLDNNKYIAISELASAMQENDDIAGAIQLYKISAIRGVKKSKKALKILNEQNLWNPETEREAKLINKRLRRQSVGQVSNPKLIRSDNFKVPRKNPIKAASISAAIAVSTYGISNSANLMVSATDLKNDSMENIVQQINDSEEILNQEFCIGDEVSLSENNTSSDSKVIGIVAYDNESKDIFKAGKFNINNFGLTTNQYLDEICKDRNIERKKLNLLYCVKTNSGEIFWIDPIKEKINLVKSYQPAKKEKEREEM